MSVIVYLERRERDLVPPAPKPHEDEGPAKKQVQKPGGENELLKRLRRVDPDRAKKYRQRSGQ
jgi:hypothetical protein